VPQDAAEAAARIARDRRRSAPRHWPAPRHGPAAPRHWAAAARDWHRSARPRSAGRPRRTLSVVGRPSPPGTAAPPGTAPAPRGATPAFAAAFGRSSPPARSHYAESLQHSVLKTDRDRDRDRQFEKIMSVPLTTSMSAGTHGPRGPHGTPTHGSRSPDATGIQRSSHARNDSPGLHLRQSHADVSEPRWAREQPHRPARAGLGRPASPLGTEASQAVRGPGSFGSERLCG
jgi:hypothetical protein